MKILICLGTRPEAIKMAPLYYELKKQIGLELKLCITAQHREMLDQVLRFFEIQADFDLDIMKHDQTLNSLSASILSKVETVLHEFQPNLVLVHGDTTTSSMAALAAFHCAIKVGHVEAGLRTYNKKSPFPEELNRQLIARIADFHFAPTQKAFNNLVDEGINKENVLLTGNTVIDALLFTIDKIKKGYEPSFSEELSKKIDFKKDIILVTGHRRESFGEGFKNLCAALLELSKNKAVEIIYPVHFNPNVKKIVYSMLSNIINIHLIDPLDYVNFVWLMGKSNLIITDSGGIQEEAPSFNIPVLVTREKTERTEGITAGFLYLVGTNKTKIINKVNDLLHLKRTENVNSNPYGDGKASEKIVAFLKEKGK